jgi:hypothetical protein
MMKNRSLNSIKRILAYAVASSLLLAMPSIYAGETDRATPDREDIEVVTLIAEVTAINHATREVTLKGEYGKELHMIVDDSVRRLNEVGIGDTVKLGYVLSIAYELREPTADELENPIQIIEGVERAGLDVGPAGVDIKVMKAVCTIEGLDRPTATVTLKGPLGRLNVVQIKDTSNLPKLRIGQSVVVTFTQALAVALEKLAD